MPQPEVYRVIQPYPVAGHTYDVKISTNISANQLVGIEFNAFVDLYNQEWGNSFIHYSIAAAIADLYENDPYCIANDVLRQDLFKGGLF